MRLVLCSRSEPVLPDAEGVLARRVDVCDDGAVEDLVAEAEARFGAIDLWVNNAGVLEPIKLVRDVPIDAWRRHLEVNLTGAFVGTRCYVNHLRRTERAGVLINLSSGAAWKAYAGWGAYCAGKAAVERLTEVVALEEAEIGLRAYSVAPGVVDTDMQALIRSTPAEDFPSVERFQALKRDEAFNSPRYVADEFLSIAFDPDRRPEAVALRLENE
jgi:NAD(P)-dependent dehydrogenase (short-subunit alcohol dehydrogenase family)